MSAHRIVVLCAGLHGRVCVETLRLAGGHELVGFLDDDPNLRGREIDGLPVLGGLEALEELVAHGGADAAVVGTANLRALDLRRRLFAHAQELGLAVPAVVHPTAVVSPSALHGDGLFLAPLASVGRGARLGRDVCLYTGCSVEHDNVLGDHAFLGTGVRTAGSVTIGPGAYLGPGVTVASGRSIGGGTIVGAGAVVVESLPAGVVAFGVPARARESVEVWRARHA